MTTAMSLSAPGLSPADMLAASQTSTGTISSAMKAKARAASKDFEAVFLNTMFQEMTTGLSGEGPFGGKGAAGVWRSMLTDEYAKAFAKAGGVGIADHVYRALIARQEAHS
jgi:peptidoglycan hydrolase FlgJ